MLLLVPSRLELDKLVPEAAGAELPWVWPDRRDAAGAEVLVASCGVGIALAGIEAMARLSLTQSNSLLLVGLAGTFDETRAPVGSLLIGSSVSLHGIGVGEGRSHRSLADVGGALADEARSAAGELALALPSQLEARTGSLLSVAAGCADAEDARGRRARHPDCLAEDMESWAVARAAERAGASCTVLRGISNRAGDRDHAGWRVDEAIAVLREAIDTLTGGAP